jgi:Zn-dependent membrane protease YugP
MIIKLSLLFTLIIWAISYYFHRCYIQIQKKLHQQPSPIPNQLEPVLKKFLLHYQLENLPLKLNPTYRGTYFNPKTKSLYVHQLIEPCTFAKSYALHEAAHAIQFIQNKSTVIQRKFTQLLYTYTPAWTSILIILSFITFKLPPRYLFILLPLVLLLLMILQASTILTEFKANQIVLNYIKNEIPLSENQLSILKRSLRACIYKELGALSQTFHHFFFTFFNK